MLFRLGHIIAWVLLLLCSSPTLYAQNEPFTAGNFSDFDPEEYTMLTTDYSLFRLSDDLHTDYYGETTRYYRAAISTKRRGIPYYLSSVATQQPIAATESLIEPITQARITAYYAQKGYRAGGVASLAKMHTPSLFSNTNTTLRTGRDMFVKGVFRNEIQIDSDITKVISNNSHLTLHIDVKYLMRGLQFGAAQECFTLTGNPYYNPTWGYYNDKERNSRVNRDMRPAASLRYQRELSPQTTLSASIKGASNTLRRSKLGWYDGYNPSPDYYQRLPSMLPYGEVREQAEARWRASDPKYTQIDWNALEKYNRLSNDGSAHYVSEDNVERLNTANTKILIEHRTDDGLTLNYGISASINNSRNYKELRDLLGATYLLDIDQIWGDNAAYGSDLQNNLQSPNRHITEGDRFGFEYTNRTTALHGLARASYTLDRFKIDASLDFSHLTMQRTGHYETERFAGNRSLGKSPNIEFSPNNLQLIAGYALHRSHYLKLRIDSYSRAPLSRDIFLNEQQSNYTYGDINLDRVLSLSASHRYSSDKLSLHSELYILQHRAANNISPLYDDISHTFCRAVTQNCTTLSYGIESSIDWDFKRNWNFSGSLSAGRYLYTNGGDITLYDDFNLQPISENSHVVSDNLHIGNTPQLTATSTLTYFGVKRYILSLSGSYAGIRYIEPSLARRTERVFNTISTTQGIPSAFATQERLSDVFDMEMSIMRLIYLDDGSRLSLRLSIRNLLGDSNRIYYARESHRIAINRLNDEYYSSTPHGSRYQYGYPRTLLVSIAWQL